MITRSTGIVLFLVALTTSVYVAGTAHARAPQRLFGDPIGVAVDSHGFVYVTDQLAAQVIKFSPAGRVVARWGKQGKGPGQLNIPQGIAVDGLGHVYVADTWNARVQKFSSTGAFLARWGANRNRLFFRPQAVAVDQGGNVYVADDQDQFVTRLSLHGQLLAQLGQFGNPTQGEFRGPTGVAVGGRGTIYVASYNWVYRVSPAGKDLGVWGTLSPGTRPGRFYMPRGLATDAQGNVYVADSGNNRIQELSPGGAVLHVWGKGGMGAARFREPNAVAVDAAGNVYVTDTLNHRVVKLSPGGAVLAIWK